MPPKLFMVTHINYCLSLGWGGIPICSALDGLSRTERQKEGKPNAVIRLTFASAFVLPEGISLADAVGLAGTSYPDNWEVLDVSALMRSWSFVRPDYSRMVMS
jgi:hypothetical protein